MKIENGVWRMMLGATGYASVSTLTARGDWSLWNGSKGY